MDNIDDIIGFTARLGDAWDAMITAASVENAGVARINHLVFAILSRGDVQIVLRQVDFPAEVELRHALVGRKTLDERFEREGQDLGGGIRALPPTQVIIDDSVIDLIADSLRGSSPDGTVALLVVLQRCLAADSDVRDRLAGLVDLPRLDAAIESALRNV